MICNILKSVLLVLVFCSMGYSEEITVREYVRYGNPCRCDYTVIDEDGEVLFRVRPTYTEIEVPPNDFDRMIREEPKNFEWEPMQLDNPVSTFKERRQ